MTRVWVATRALLDNDACCVQVHRHGFAPELCYGADIEGPSRIRVNLAAGPHVWLETEADVVTHKEP